MMQAIATLERAVGRLEQEAGKLTMAVRSQSSPGMDVAAARQALHSLDQLIGDLKGRTDG